MSPPNRLQIIQGDPNDPSLELVLNEGALQINNLKHQHLHRFCLPQQFAEHPTGQECWQRISKLMQDAIHDQQVSWNELQQSLFQIILELNEQQPELAALILADYVEALKLLIPALEAPYRHLAPETLIINDFHYH